MHALVISLALLGQAEIDNLPTPPAPAPAIAEIPSPAPADNVEDLKAWLLGQLIVDMSFDPQKSAEVERMLDRMNERQIKALVEAYK